MGLKQQTVVSFRKMILTVWTGFNLQT